MYSACVTVAEYRTRTRWERFLFRASRHPIIAHLAIPPLLFLVLYRVPFDSPGTWRRERRGVHLTNAGIAAVIGVLGLALGFDAVALIELPIMVVGAIAKRGFSMSARAHSRSTMPCSSGASWGDTSTAPAARRAILSE